MPRPDPAEFRARAIALVRAGKPPKQTADDLGIHPLTLSKWIKQDDIDREVHVASRGTTGIAVYTLSPPWVWGSRCVRAPSQCS